VDRNYSFYRVALVSQGLYVNASWDISARKEDESIQRGRRRVGISRLA